MQCIAQETNYGYTGGLLGIDGARQSRRGDQKRVVGAKRLAVAHCEMGMALSALTRGEIPSRCDGRTGERMMKGVEEGEGKRCDRKAGSRFDAVACGTDIEYKRDGDWWW